MSPEHDKQIHPRSQNGAFFVVFVKEGFSLEQQKEEIAKFCQDNGYELVKIYEDAGISGAKVDKDDLSIDRPGLQLLSELL